MRPRLTEGCGKKGEERGELKLPSGQNLFLSADFSHSKWSLSHFFIRQPHKLEVVFR